MESWTSSNWGGSDSASEGHVANFVDVQGGQDGTDDGLRVERIRMFDCLISLEPVSVSVDYH